MYITGVKFRVQGQKKARGWRFSAGIGKMRPVVSVIAAAQDLENLAYAINFALSGKRPEHVAEVWLDAADDAGDVWTIERGAKGSVFRKNSRVLSIEEAQRSLLASLLDLDASLSPAEGLVAPVELRQIITRGADVAATKWEINGGNARTEVSGIVAAREVAEKCAAKMGRVEFADPRKLSRIAGPSARMLGAFEELRRQRELLGNVSDEDKKVDQSLEAIQVEVDLLNHIDQLLRRVNEGGETVARLSTLLDTHQARLRGLEAKWTKETLVAVQQLTDPCAILDQLVRLRAWGRFAETLQRVNVILDEQIKPVNASSIKVWDEFLSGSRSGGQEIESCLASMLLGVKQLGLEVDRYVSQSPVVSSPVSTPRATTWWDRLKSGSTSIVDDRFREAAPALRNQREWITRLAREVEAVKVATEYALQSSQGLTDKVEMARDKVTAETATLSSLFHKVRAEHDRLKQAWSEHAAKLGVHEAIGLEDASSLIRDANEYLVIVDTHNDLAIRVEDRRTVQSSLEAAVRQWWDIIGSHKTTDLSNVSFLIVEAKGALRYREGRRNRIQKGLEETARAMGAASMSTWIDGRQEEILREWGKLFSAAELSAPDMTGDSAREVVDAAHRCAALLDIARLEEQERFAAASLWPSRLDSAVVIYRWPDAHIAASQRTSFLKSLNSFVGDGTVPVVLLISDAELAGVLAKSGAGGANSVEIDDITEIDGPRREGAGVKSEIKARRVATPDVPSPVVKGPVTSGGAKKSLLSSRAEAALKVLNPKAVK